MQFFCFLTLPFARVFWDEAPKTVPDPSHSTIVLMEREGSGTTREQMGEKIIGEQFKMNSVVNRMNEKELKRKGNRDGLVDDK